MSEAAKFRECVSRALMDRAFSYANDYAWQRKEALEVIDELSSCNVAIAGIDVWMVRDGTPAFSSFVYGWSSTSSETRIRDNAGARGFIADFAWDLQDNARTRNEIPYFNLTLY